MADPRWTWENEFVLLQQDTSMIEPQKVGLWVPAGWAVHARNGTLFVKTFDPVVDQIHPDFNSNVELFTNDEILEVETLGSLIKLAAETAVTHTEAWHLFQDIPQPNTEADVHTNVMPAVNTIFS